MAKVEIADEVFEALRAQAKNRLHSDDPSRLLAQVAHSYLADVCAPGFDHDALTGSLTRQRLMQRVNRATFGSSWTDRTLYRERFLCVDIDNFKKYLDVHGMTDGDVVLRRLAHDLHANYGKDDVYRTGGDDFVVVLGDREPWLPAAPPEVTFTHALVKVALSRNQHQNHHVCRWIEIHLDAGTLASKPACVGIECGNPLWLEQA